MSTTKHCIHAFSLFYYINSFKNYPYSVLHRAFEPCRVFLISTTATLCIQLYSLFIHSYSLTLYRLINKKRKRWEREMWHFFLSTCLLLDLLLGEWRGLSLNGTLLLYEANPDIYFSLFTYNVIGCAWPTSFVSLESWTFYYPARNVLSRNVFYVTE